MKKIIFAACLMTALPLCAQSPPDAIKLGDVYFTATLRLREYVWNWFQPTTAYQNQYAYTAGLLRLNFAEKRGALDLDAEIAVPFLLDLPNNATAPGDGLELAPKNATVAILKRDRLASRLIGTFAFSDVGRSFDGFHYDWTQLPAASPERMASSVIWKRCSECKDRKGVDRIRESCHLED